MTYAQQAAVVASQEKKSPLTLFLPTPNILHNKVYVCCW
jgi:hypothetical protein